MAKYIRKPVIVEAVQWFPEVGNSIQDVYANEAYQYATTTDKDGERVLIQPGDWCVRGRDLLVHVYRSEQFKELFEEVFPGINSK